MESMFTIQGRVFEQMTDEQFVDFCLENSNLKFERDSQGRIIIMSPTSYLTGRMNNEILYQLTAWNKNSKLGEVVDSDTGFFLANGAMRNPDAAWTSHDKLKGVAPDELTRFPHLCPDFIVELKSKSDSLPELQQKMVEWIENGCRLAWLIDPEKQKVFIYSIASPVKEHLGFDAPINGGDVLPGFSLILSELR
jgi:Uma2 family endonuclease